jgi:hypothetical protein
MLSPEQEDGIVREASGAAVQDTACPEALFVARLRQWAAGRGPLDPLELGGFLLDGYFAGDVKLALSRNPRKERSFRKLLPWLGRAGEPSLRAYSRALLAAVRHRAATESPGPATTGTAPVHARTGRHRLPQVLKDFRRTEGILERVLGSPELNPPQLAQMDVEHVHELRQRAADAARGIERLQDLLLAEVTRRIKCFKK